MQLPTLNQFIEDAKRAGWPRNAYVRQRGCSELYVRWSSRKLGDRRINGVLDIGRIEVRHPGRGLFTRLVNRLLAQGIPVYVECVMNERFAAMLGRIGFTRIVHDPSNDAVPSSFYKLP